MKSAVLPLSLLVTLSILTGCRSYSRPPGLVVRSETRFEYEWRKYIELPGFKSMAVAGDPSSLHVSGVAYAYPLPAMAVSAAIGYCEERRNDRDLDEPCETYAIGDELAADRQ